MRGRSVSSARTECGFSEEVFCCRRLESLFDSGYQFFDALQTDRRDFSVNNDLKIVKRSDRRIFTLNSRNSFCHYRYTAYGTLSRSDYSYAIRPCNVLASVQVRF